MVLVLIAVGGCGAEEPLGPLEVADRAASEGSLERAVALYDDVAAATSSTEEERFRATLDAARCLARHGRVDEGFARFRTLYPRFRDAMRVAGAHKYLAWFVDAAAAGPGGPRALLEIEDALMRQVERRHPTRVEEFRALLDRHRRRAGPDDAPEKLPPNFANDG